MAINFPNSPTTNQIYTTGGFSWQWNGTSWVGLGQSSGLGPTGPTGAQGSSAVTADYGLITGTVDSSNDYGSIV